MRHNLSLNKCFEKIDKPAGSTHRKGCLWTLNPSKAAKLEEEVLKCARKDAPSIRKSMEYPGEWNGYCLKNLVLHETKATVVSVIPIESNS